MKTAQEIVHFIKSCEDFDLKPSKPLTNEEKEKYGFPQDFIDLLNAGYGDCYLDIDDFGHNQDLRLITLDTIRNEMDEYYPCLLDFNFVMLAIDCSGNPFVWDKHNNTLLKIKGTYLSVLEKNEEGEWVDEENEPALPIILEEAIQNIGATSFISYLDKMLLEVEAKNHYKKAFEFYHLKDKIMAYQEAEKVISLCPDLPNGYYLYGYFLINMGDVENAEPYLNHALDKGEQEAGYYIAEALLFQGKEEEAILRYKQALKSSKSAFWDNKEKFTKEFNENLPYIHQYGISEEKYFTILEKVFS
jgi:tetratricopeptide (TPR) repeat protein